MIQVTLNFASIEAARAALLEIPQNSLVGSPAPAAAPAKIEEAPAPKERKAAAKTAEPAAGETTAKAAAAPAKTESAPTPTAEPAVEEQPASTAVDYPTLQKAVFALAGKSRDAATATAALFGVKTFKELPEAKWGEALRAVNAKLAELEAA